MLLRPLAGPLFSSLQVRFTNSQTIAQQDQDFARADHYVLRVAHGAACIYACSDNPNESYTELVNEVESEYPNTKVIGYRYGLKEEDTLVLIDDVLNAWGR